MKKLSVIQLVEKFQCPGCTCGSDTTCGQYKPGEFPGSAGSATYCIGHVPGTFIMPGGGISLGLPKGFNRFGAADFGPKHVGITDGKWHPQTPIHLWPLGSAPDFDVRNVAVWAMELDGFLFIRSFSPRINRTHVEVVQGGTRAELCPDAIDVATFIDEID